MISLRSFTGDGTSSNVLSKWWIFRFFSAHLLKVKKSTLESGEILTEEFGLFSWSIIFKWCSTHILSAYYSWLLQNFLKLATDASSKVLNSFLFKYPSLSRSNKSKTKRIFSLVELRQIMESPQQNSLKSINPDRSLSNNLNADSATYYIKWE